MLAGRGLEQDVVAGVRIKGRIELNQVDALVAYTNWVLCKAAPGFDNTISCAIVSGDRERALNGAILPARASAQCEEPGMQATIASTDAELVPFWSALIRDRRIAPAVGLGFTSGMPFLLTYSTQSAWLTDAGVPLATIGLLSELTLAYKFKFVWAPFLDQYDPRSEEHTSELQSLRHLVCRLLLE